MLDAGHHRHRRGQTQEGPITLVGFGHQVFSRAQLLDAVWGMQVFIEERTVDVHVRRLRKALAEHGADAYIQTVRGAGYRFTLERQGA